MGSLINLTWESFGWSPSWCGGRASWVHCAPSGMLRYGSVGVPAGWRSAKSCMQAVHRHICLGPTAEGLLSLEVTHCLPIDMALTGWARQGRVYLVERRVWRAVVLWWRAMARVVGFLSLGFENACLQAGGCMGPKACRNRLNAHFRMAGRLATSAGRKCGPGIATQPVGPRAARALRARLSGL